MELLFTLFLLVTALDWPSALRSTVDFQQILYKGTAREVSQEQIDNMNSNATLLYFSYFSGAIIGLALLVPQLFLNKPDSPRLAVAGLLVGAAYYLDCLFVAKAVRTNEARAVELRPELKHCLSTAQERRSWTTLHVLGFLLCSTMAAMFIAGSSVRQAIGGVVGCLILIQVYKVAMDARKVRLADSPLPSDSPQTQALSDLCERAQFEFSKVHLSRSFVSMGSANLDGGVTITPRCFADLTPTELAALVAHEIRHTQRKDAAAYTITAKTSAGILTLVWLSLIAVLALQGWHDWLAAFAWPYAMLFTRLNYVASSFLMRRRSIPAEYDCDAFAASLVSPAAMASVLAKLSLANCTSTTYGPVMGKFITHPDVKDRWKALGFSNPTEFVGKQLEG